MPPAVSRRSFLATTVGALPAISAEIAAPQKAFSFVLLGDLHFDRPEHHDFDWVKGHSPDSVRQSANYSRITREIMPSLFQTVREQIAARHATAAPVACVLQVGDVVEGLCGTEELAARQNREALEFVEGCQLGVPMLFTKGNHDVTGPGSLEMYRRIFHPYLSEQARQLVPGSEDIRSARYPLTVGNAQFVFFDAYDPQSLEWLEAVAKSRTAEHCFVVVHPPVVPYGARSTWYLYSGAKDQARRAKLLEILGDQRAIVLGGHIHKFNTIVRTAGRRGFAQLAISSVISKPAAAAKDVLAGTAQYTGDQVKVEPAHSPVTEPERRAVYDREREFVKAFEYADLPGYAVVTVDGPSVTAEIYGGVGKELWRRVDLAGLLGAARGG